MNLKKIFTMMLVLCFIVTSMYAAKKVDFVKDSKKQAMEALNQQNLVNVPIEERLGLSKDGTLNLVRNRMDFNRITHNRYQQEYKGIPVWGVQTVISRNVNNSVVRLHGSLYLDLANDNIPIPNNLDPTGALAEMKNAHIATNPDAKWFFENEKAETFIYIKKNGKGRVAYVVSFFADNEKGEPSQHIFFIDAKNGKILETYDMLRNADGNGPGGNEKIGQYYYGTDYPAFGVTQSGSTCTMDTADVKTINLNHGTSGTTPYSFTCPENTVKTINGAYSPLNDAQYFGQVVYDMYNTWYGVPPLTFQLTMRVHYSTNYENAFWNGSSMTFGDGYTTFYPLVSLDVSAHEVAHGFTEQNSDLIYSGQSGGINESYSDMAGESAEYFSRGSNDFLIGYDIFKNPTGALRYMEDPTLDGISIGHVDDYYSGMDVHYSSGVFNRVFYLIATTSGWNTRMAFDIFTKANQDYWTTGTTFQQGAEGAMSAAIDYGYNCQDVVNAFAVVGISLTCPGPPTADFSGTPVTGGFPLTVTFTDLSSGATSWSWDFGDSGTSTLQNPVHTYNTMGTYTVTLTATNSSGSDVMTKTNYITVTSPQAPVADFSASNVNPTTGENVTFTDLTTENPTSWSWTFENGTPATSTDQNPVVSWSTAGTYSVSLTATNAQGTDTETKTGYIVVAEIPYCDSQGNNWSYEWIGRVQVDDLDNASGAAGYTDFTSISEELIGGSNVSVTLTPEFSSTTYTEYWKIWIDYNGDHDFDDAGEEVFSGVGTAAVSGNFTVASGIDITTRMRVSMKWNATQTSCETFSYGEVEDYTVVINSGGGTAPVADFTAGATTIYEGDSITFTDTSANNPTSWAWTFNGGTPGTSSAQNPTITYNTAGTYTVALTATNAYGSDTETKTNYITVNVIVVDPPVADFTASATTINEGQSITFTDTSTNSPTSWSWSFPGGTPSTSTAQNPTITYDSAGTYSVTLTATNSGGSDDEVKTDFITVNPVTSGIVFEKGKLTGVSNSWQTVTLANTYTSPVVVCSNDLGTTGIPAVTRVRNAAGNSFEVMVQNPSGSALAGYNVYYLVVEEGVYTSAADGVTMEAVKVNSSATAENNNWVTEARTYQNTYTNPVVLGQVMTYNDTGWSVFWASGSARANPPSASAFYAGKEVAEDTDTTRADETIGYIVIEQGSGTINGVAYTAALGADTVRGPENNSVGYTYSYGGITNASAAIISTAGMDGGNGGWPVFFGANQLTDTSITMYFDEDQVGDTERRHTTEQVAYIVFGQ
jgi:PKD repeat protein